MRVLRASEDRGNVRTGWLNAKHTFSFGQYYDPDWMAFGPLRVINEDRVAPGRGFPTHPHQNMEILTFVIDGELGHKDSTGGEGSVQYGEIQYMSAGTGVQHSEYNLSPEEELHLLQIWLMPKVQNAEPYYAQKRFDPKDRKGKWVTYASPDGQDDSIEIRQDAHLHGVIINEGSTVKRGLRLDQAYWLHVVSGEVRVDDKVLKAGDALGIVKEAVVLEAEGVAGESELLLFELNVE